MNNSVTFSSIFSEAVFCGNAILIINNNTPYNGIYGRIPCVLPSVSQITGPSGQGAKSDNTLRHVHRMREISVGAIVELSARARLGRAMDTRITMPAQM